LLPSRQGGLGGGVLGTLTISSVWGQSIAPEYGEKNKRDFSPQRHKDHREKYTQRLIIFPV